MDRRTALSLPFLFPFARHALAQAAPGRAARQRAAEPPAFYVDVLGPVSADSLAVLKRRLRPLLR